MRGRVVMGVLAALWVAGSAWSQETTTVVVAAVDLEPGMPILERELKVVDLGGATLPFEPVRSRMRVVGAIAREPIFAGEVIRRERLSTPNLTHPTAFENLVPDGLRAWAFVSEDERPDLVGGDHVDVVWRPDDARYRPCRLVQVAKVLGHVDIEGRLELQRPSVSYRSAVILVSPEQAVAIETARTAGALVLSVRSYLDLEPHSDEACPSPLPGVRP